LRASAIGLAPRPPDRARMTIATAGARDPTNTPGDSQGSEPRLLSPPWRLL
jgi:hypothetical protein